MKKSTVFHRSLFALSLGCALASLPLAVRAQDAPTPPPEATPIINSTVESTAGKTLPKVAADQKFSESEKVIARKFANGNEGEVEEAKLALTNAESQEVKDFATKMVEEHGKANEELIAIANAHGMDLKPELTTEEHATYNRMKQMKGTNFDGMYAKHAVADHQDDVKEYQEEIKTIKDKDLLAYAQKTLPIIEEHLKMAQGLKGEASVSGEAKSAKKHKSS